MSTGHFIFQYLHGEVRNVGALILMGGTKELRPRKTLSGGVGVV